ncbi:MAG: sensor histidine kinase [Myxococcota bacterium]
MAAELNSQAAPTVAEPSRAEELAAALRSASARAAELAGDGIALLFAEIPGNEAPAPLPPLRAAAGFDSPGAARAAANTVGPSLFDVIEQDRIHVADSPASLGEAAQGGLWIAPLGFDGRVHGALVVGSPKSPDEDMKRALELLSRSVAVRLDHLHLADRLAQIRSSEPESDGDESDEILKLSEALFAQDIELLRNNEKLGKVEKLKNDFIEKMSRELRTPLNSIIEAIISVLAGENEHLSDGAKSGLRQALDDGTSFLRTLQNILDLWKIKQGELPLEAQEVNIREVVEEAIFSVQDAIGDKDLTIHRDFQEPLPKLRTDLAKVNHVLFLLLDNAVKFTPHGRIDIVARLRGDRLICEIKDSGIGICPDDQQVIFDEFYQVDELASTKYTGSGLGLALVRDLLVLLDGEIELSSEVGYGSTFRFDIPVQVIG